MSTPDCTAAHQLLKQFDCGAEPRSFVFDRQQVQQAVVAVVQGSEYQMFGICADHQEQAIAALQNYLRALGYDPPTQFPEPLAGPIYLKYNVRTKNCYTDSYSGPHRGVLLSCQSPTANGLNEMYGHMPLDLFVDTPRKTVVPSVG